MFLRGKEELNPAAVVFFLFASFSFFKSTCGYVENPRADQDVTTNRRPNHNNGSPETFESRPRSGREMHAQMLSFEDSTIRFAVFPAGWRKRVEGRDERQ